jgi:exodeoxyribonuclease VII large subunit
MEDLWCFNDREVARAIVECPIPVVAASGHETDTTIAELVADERCATPTQAAMRLTPDREALTRQLDATRSRLDLLITRRIDASSKHVTLLARTPLFANPAEHFAAAAEELVHAHRHLGNALRTRLLQAKQHITHHTTRVERTKPTAVLARLTQQLRSSERDFTRAMTTRLVRNAAQLTAAQRTLEAVSPNRVLERGFSVTTRADGTIVRKPADVRAGELLATRLAEGTIASRVEGAQQLPKLTSRKRTSAPPQGPNLFDIDR